MPDDDLPRLRGLPAQVAAHSRILLLGSFPSEQSLARSEYYANPRNHFWQIMSQLFEIAPSAGYSERLERLHSFGVGIWDVIGECQRKGSLDSRIVNPVPNDLCGLLTSHPAIRQVAFNGGSAQAIARRLTPEVFRLPRVAIARFPSTSPAHAVKLETKLGAWAQLKIWSEEGAWGEERVPKLAVRV